MQFHHKTKHYSDQRNVLLPPCLDMEEEIRLVCGKPATNITQRLGHVSLGMPCQQNNAKCHATSAACVYACTLVRRVIDPPHIAEPDVAVLVSAASFTITSRKLSDRTQAPELLRCTYRVGRPENKITHLWP